IRLDLVRQGAKAVAHAFEGRASQAPSVAITDATSNEDLLVLAAAAKNLKLVPGGSGLALGLGQNFGLQPGRAAQSVAPSGRRAILAGSCSRMTLKQLEVAKKIYPHFRVAPEELAAQFEITLDRVLNWAKQHRSDPNPLLVYTSGSPDEIASNQKTL